MNLWHEKERENWLNAISKIVSINIILFDKIAAKIGDTTV